MLLTARRYAPGSLRTPREAGAIPVTICRLSGQRATERCPTAIEWFLPGTEPTDDCVWHAPDGLHLPAEYAEWSAGIDVRASAVASSGVGRSLAAADSSTAFRIVSPRDGDRYHVPPGVDPRYATVALRARGADADVSWSIDGRPTTTGRFRLVSGAHRIVAWTPKGERDSVVVQVE